ncbi:MAG: TIGR04076 family protein [Candidatus Omnitrophota bacterium]
MRNYLTELKEDPAYEAANALAPEGLCPFLFYNLTPYIYTLARGGWFGWVKRHKNPLYRKASGGMDFGKSRVNRLFPNEVLVRCPRPRAMVVAGVGPWTDGKIKIRILRSHDACLSNHRNEEEFILDARSAEKKALNLNVLFPETLARSLTKKIPWGRRDLCAPSELPGIRVSEIISPCRYHEKKDEKKDLRLLPGGFCPHVFARIYPQVLAMMYGKSRSAETSEKLGLFHPGTEEKIMLVLRKTFRTKTPGVRTFRSVLKKACEAVSLPVDLLDYDLEIEVLKAGPDKCSLEEGKKYTVNLRSKDFLCPAAFHVVYPYLLLASAGHRMKWDSEDNPVLSPCPDCAGAVYSLARKRGIEQNAEREVRR